MILGKNKIITNSGDLFLSLYHRDTSLVFEWFSSLENEAKVAIERGQAVHSYSAQEKACFYTMLPTIEVFKLPLPQNTVLAFRSDLPQLLSSLWHYLDLKGLRTALLSWSLYRLRVLHPRHRLKILWGRRGGRECLLCVGRSQDFVSEGPLRSFYIPRCWVKLFWAGFLKRP